MSTQYYLKFFPESELKFDISKKVRQSLITEHNLNRIIDILQNERIIENETAKVINKGVRGPYTNGYYCGFNFNDEFDFWHTLVKKYPDNGLLNLIFAEYLVQTEKGYFTAHQFYKKAFEIDYRLIFSIEPSWRDELLEQDFEYELYYLRTQKDDYDKDDFVELVLKLKTKYINDVDKIEKIDRVNAG